MADRLAHDFPLFPLGLVVLPGEIVPLHIFEERYKTMIGECLARDREFGIVWLSDEGLRELGCSCRIERLLDQMQDGRMNLLARGSRPIRVIERISTLPYPAGVVEFVTDRPERVDQRLREQAQHAYAQLVRRATDRESDPVALGAMSAYEMAATVDFGLEAKQGLLNLRSENARLRLVTRLFRAAIRRLDVVDNAQARARSNGKVRFT
jgi:Lon protease-like protein